MSIEKSNVRSTEKAPKMSKAEWLANVASVEAQLRPILENTLKDDPEAANLGQIQALMDMVEILSEIPHYISEQTAQS